MKYEALQQAASYSKARRQRKRWQKVVTFLAAIVVFCTSYALILPAITKERPKLCELQEHTHIDTCWQSFETADGEEEAEPILLCKLQEHTHGEACHADPTADVEEAEDWEATLPQELSGKWAEDALCIAVSQLGYHESEKNYIVDENDTKYGYTRYGQWYGEPYIRWDAAFVSFCLNYAEVDKEFFPFDGVSNTCLESLTEQEFYRPAMEATAKNGDLIFFDTDSDKKADRVGIVVEQLPSANGKLPKLKTIEGDQDNCVAYCEYQVSDRSILGYVDIAAAQSKYEVTFAQRKSYADDSVTVEATYYAAAQIPKNAELSVTRIEADSSDAYESCYEEALQLLRQYDCDANETHITDFKLYDICFLLDGQEIQPQAAVDIQIRIPNARTAENVTVIHYEYDSAEIPAEQNITLDDQGVLNATFETESFSLFAVVTTQSTSKNFVRMSKFSVSTSNIQSLAGKTFAIAAGNYALSVGEGPALGSKALLAQEDTTKTGEESLVCWAFERSSGSNYYIKTTYDGTTYYLAYANGALSLVGDKNSAAVFTATRSGTNLTISNGGSYLNITANGASMGSSSALTLYTIPNGPFTVTFDGQIGLPTYMSSSNKKYTGAQKVTKQTDANGYITLPTAAETAVPGNYPMRLTGWYDIINKVYYDETMLGQTIRVTNDSIFYPEWIAATYDIGQDVNVVKGQPDTSDFIETHVYDYTELFNMHSANYIESTSTWEFDPDSELGFIFFDYLTVGNIGNISNKDVAVDGVTVNNEKTDGTRGSSTTFPGTITAGIANDARLEALFGYGTFAGRHHLGEADWLYSFDEETGFYYYNSGCNAAAYNQSLQRFYVYDHVVNIDSQNSLNDFLPFNYGESKNYGNANKYAEKDNEANYWFGMKSEIKFYLPDDSGSGKNKSAKGTDMQLRFSGDDDVWIFVDGELVLDLGGVHDVVYGEVNFSTGKVTTGQALSKNAVAVDTTGTYADMPGVTYGAAGVTTTNLPHVIEGGMEHTITIYYLERGSSLSNCAVYFNLSPAYELLITKQDTNGSEMLEGAKFQVYEDEACTTPASLYIIDDNGTRVESTDSIFTTGADGTVRCWGLLPNKTYWIKEISPPDGYPVMSQYTIKIDLNVIGEAVIITIDSTGNEWTFADAYYRVSDTEHMIGIDVYNDKFIIDEESEMTEVYVEKVWAEGSENIPEEIVIDLLANDEATGRSLKLNAENQWKGTFYQLPVKNPDGVEIEYTVKEVNVPEGYRVTYETIEGRTETVLKQEGHWSTTNTLEDGRIYRFVASGVAVANVSGSTLSPVTPSETDETQQWKATTLGNGFLLTNVSTGRNLTISSSSATASTTTSGNNVTITLSDGQIRSQATSYGRTCGLLTSTSQISSSSWRTPTTHTVYVWNEPVYEEVDAPGGWRVTNSPMPTTMDIPVQKHWDATVPDASKVPVIVRLYLVDEATSVATLHSTIEITADDAWIGTFEDVDRPEEGTYYCIVEHTTGFEISYSETVSVFIDQQRTEAAKVTIGENGDPAQVDITNALLVVLPQTGGMGAEWYTLGGLVLIAASILLLYKHQKRRKEDFASS